MQLPVSALCLTAFCASQNLPPRRGRVGVAFGVSFREWHAGHRPVGESLEEIFGLSIRSPGNARSVAMFSELVSSAWEAFASHTELMSASPKEEALVYGQRVPTTITANSVV